MRGARIALVAVGLAIAAFGVALLVLDVPLDELVWLPVWLLAAIVIHDAVIVPSVALLRRGLHRRGRMLPPAVVAIVEAGFAVGAVLTLYVSAELWAQSRTPVNPTLLTGPYGLRLAVVWGVIAVVVAGVSWALIARSPRPAGDAGPTQRRRA